MTIKDNSISVVIVGKWNRYILNPMWVAENIFNVAEVQTQFSLSLDAPPRYVHNNIFFVPHKDKVIISCTSLEENYLDLMEEYAKRLVDILTVTPINGLGMNATFLLNEEELDEILALSRFPDDAKLSDLNWQIKNPIIKRTLIQDNIILNLEFKILEPIVEISANFHHDIKSANDISTFLAEKRFNNYREVLLTIIKKCYNLELDKYE